MRKKSMKSENNVLEREVKAVSSAASSLRHPATRLDPRAKTQHRPAENLLHRWRLFTPQPPATNQTKKTQASDLLSGLIPDPRWSLKSPTRSSPHRNHRPSQAYLVATRWFASKPHYALDNVLPSGTGHPERGNRTQKQNIRLFLFSQRS